MLSCTFQFRVPKGVTGSHTFNKLVIETNQTDEIDALYLGEGIEMFKVDEGIFGASPGGITGTGLDSLSDLILIDLFE
jgi:hypothetical protein